MKNCPHGLVVRWWNHALLQKVCNHFQLATQVPFPPQQVIGSHQYHLQTHQKPAIFHVSHDPSCHENPPSNLPYDNLKHRRKRKYLATSLEIAHFEFELMNILIIIQVCFM